MTFEGSLTHERYCTELLAETAALRAILHKSDLSATVPTCPDWSLTDLVLHVGGAHRWAGALVAARATENIDMATLPGIEGPADVTPDTLDAWLAEGVDETVRELRAAGPDAAVWTWSPVQRAGFWARRMTHETLIHRADAALTAGVDFAADPEVAADCVEEWLQLCAMPALAERLAAKGEPLFGPGRSIHLHATDTSPELNAEWFLDLSGDRLVHRRGHEKAAVALRGPLTEVLRVFYRRLPADSELVEIVGDRALLDLWLEYATFG
ncbi:maleylpyruvate isomerase family mycothiol-dependent enzyme [Streptomyces pinistramenti]|uniref:maleylpyruvate isomerase family mycothiol-dependent enzyme n=1 Tax=Streptomyces pinistramenti TaxID=2884812 RepID=UPI001D0817F1|nr:maleylpyruvate isomerase family mycothiol-dependent enzyme [Streptomyces pinistramenti]MCB5907110.1 maleylpyruvate isomerase family mycothiol-dependent enzyme [Streptomyces pinistramenti]